MFVGSLVRENRPVLDLINRRYTYLNERLASHYGVPGVIGPASAASCSRPKPAAVDC
jgi:hypothetical protein